MKKVLKSFFIVMSAIIIGVVTFSTSFAGEDQLSLQYRPRVGQSFNMMEYYDFHVTLPENQFLSDIRISLGIGYVLKVIRVAENGEVTAQLNIHSLMNRTPGILGQTEIYDSTDLFALPSRNTLPFALLVGSTVEIQLNPDGKVIGVNFPESYYDEVLNRLVEKDENQKKILKEKINRCLTEVTSRPNQKIMWDLFPKTPVSVGDSWQKNVESETSGLPFTQEVTYTLKERQNGIAVIEVSGQVLSINIPVMEASQNITQLNGELTGTIEVLEDSGWALRSDMKLNFAGEIQEKNPYLTDNNEKQSSFSLEGRFLTKPYGE